MLTSLYAQRFRALSRQHRVNIQRIDWQDTIPLRHRVLWPNESLEFCHVVGDSKAWHFGAFIDTTLVSVASVYPDSSSIRLRKFATDTEHQGKGIGSAVLRKVLAEARDSGFSVFWCDARESAISFYEQFGMKAEGEKFFKASLPYFKMSIKLQ